MADIYFIKMSLQEQLDNNFYHHDLETKIQGVNIGDFVFIAIPGKTKNSTYGVEKLCKIKSIDMTRNNVYFEDVYTLDNQIKTTAFSALKLFKLDVNLIINTCRQPSMPFVKISLADLNDRTIESKMEFENYCKIESNYRKIIIKYSIEDVDNDSKDIQLYFDDNREIQLKNNTFMSADLLSKYSFNNYSKNEFAGVKKGSFYKKIKAIIDNKDGAQTTFNYEWLVPFYDLFISGVESKKKEKSDVIYKKVDLFGDSVETNEGHVTTEKGENRIIYGIPGCGKSYYVDNILLSGFDKDNNVIRTTFHPEYTNTDFIGQLRPVKDYQGIDYKVIPGPFTTALYKALSNPENKVALVIEEINRGNASAIFGDIFQLLDRDINGVSEYSITNKIIEDYLKQENKNINKIVLPSNLYIYATMNTSDQNVFKLDTAFKRRWKFKRLTNKSTKKEDLKKLYFEIPGTCIKSWKVFVDSINAIIVEHSDELNGDRQLGYWFAKNDIDKEGFANKVVEYLYNDVLKYVDKNIIFNPIYNSFDDVYDAFINGDNVFVSNVILDDMPDEDDILSDDESEDLEA